jgi:uroporphyrinogen-III decarboxylase
LNSLKRVQSVVRFLRADRPPVIPEVVGVTATLNGVAPREYAKSGEVIAQCQLSAQKMIGYDCLFAIADLCVEA